MPDENPNIKNVNPLPNKGEQAARVLAQFGLQNVKTALFPPTPKLKNGGSDFTGTVQVGDSDTAIKSSMLGTLVWNNVIIKPGSYVLSSYIESVGQVIYNEDNISYLDNFRIEGGLEIDTVLIEISQAKNIVKTAIEGRNGTVKEYISDGDYEITMRGAIVGKNAMQYPLEEVEGLIEILKVPDDIEIVSSFLQLFGIQNVVVESYSLPQTEGVMNMQMFEIKLVSDTPIELVI